MQEDEGKMKMEHIEQAKKQIMLKMKFVSNLNEQIRFKQKVNKLTQDDNDNENDKNGILVGLTRKQNSMKFGIKQLVQQALTK